MTQTAKIFAAIFMLSLLASPVPTFAQQKPKPALNCPAYCFDYCEKNATPGGRGKTNCQVSCQQQCEMVKAGMK